MANALVIHKNQLPLAQRIVRAAQYVRMSTDYQRYSIENQAAVIAAYAQLHNLSIVRTYRDDGESGLRIKNRTGLTQLLDDVRSGNADFGHILVFDVSRWGRFQDIDESAHYEFICRQGGIKIAYCAEEFDNDGSLISSIVKNIKRVMAAEFSRELSAKVFAGSSNLTRLGFKMGGQVGYGLERFVVDEKSQPKGVLTYGERKFLKSDHVRVRPGAVEERAVVKRIFQEYLQGRSQVEICRALNLEGIPGPGRHIWNYTAVGGILRNEAYIGNLVYNRASQKLKTKRVRNPREHWIISEGSIEPILDSEVFFAARKRLKEYRVDISKEEMLVRLRKVLIKRGRLSRTVIANEPGLPCPSTYMKHFGTLRNLYRLIGYDNTKYWDDREAYRRWADLNRANGTSLCQAFQRAGARATFDPSEELLLANEAVSISFGVAKCRKYEGRPARWTLRRRVRQTMGWTIATRLSEGNMAVLDYVLLPSPAFTRSYLWFAEADRRAMKIECFETFGELSRSLIRRVRKATCRAPTKRQLPKQKRQAR